MLIVSHLVGSISYYRSEIIMINSLFINGVHVFLSFCKPPGVSLAYYTIEREIGSGYEKSDLPSVSHIRFMGTPLTYAFLERASKNRKK